MSANEINTTQSVRQAPPTPTPNQAELNARLVRAEQVQRELESNSPRTEPPPPASEPYKGEAIDLYA